MYVFSIHMSEKNIQELSFTKTEILIVKYLFKHYKDRFNARQLAKQLNINHANANKLCIGLYNKKLFAKEDIGNAIYYSFNYGNQEALKFIEYLLSIEEKQFPKWLKVELYQLKKLRENIKLGFVFGSSIKSDRFNDIDVFLMYDKKRTESVNKIKTEIRKSGLIEKPIRYVEITEKDIEKNKNEKIFYSIISDNLIFHNVQKYIEVVLCLR